MRSLFTIVAIFVLVAASSSLGFLAYVVANQQPHKTVVETKQVAPNVVVHRELIVFGGPWCKPCVKMRKIVDLVRSYFSITEIDPQAQDASQWNIENCPTFIAVDNVDGHLREVARFVGELSADELYYLIRDGKVPHREPTQVLPSPNHDEQQSIQNMTRTLVLNDQPLRIHGNESHKEERSTPPPKKTKPQSCPCKFYRPNPWRVR